MPTLTTACHPTGREANKDNQMMEYHQLQQGHSGTGHHVNALEDMMSSNKLVKMDTH